MKAKTDDSEKAPLSRLPWKALGMVSRVQEFGFKKYRDYDNYRRGMEVGRNLSCALRHIAAHQEGETLDPESGLPHLSHAACRMLFVLQNLADQTAIDDRYKRPKPSKRKPHA